MGRPTAGLAAAALAFLLCACAAGPAAAHRRLLQLHNPDDVLFRILADGLAQLGADARLNITRPEQPAGGVGTAAAAQPPVNASVAQVAKALATVMAAASIQSEALSNLGNPEVFPYPDGSGRVALYRMPPKGRPKGTCIFVHGCKHDPYSWFYKSKKCPLCTGLPEEVSHSKQCLARGYAVLALMSLDRQYHFRCFASSGDGNDHPSTAELIRTWSAQTRLHKKPMYMFGVSSGASFAIKFPGTMQIDGIVSEVNMPGLDSWGMLDSKGRFKHEVPPTVFYRMKRDKKTAGEIKDAVRAYNDNDVPVGVIDSPPREVDDRYLYERSFYITKKQSRDIAFWLKQIGVLDENGWVQYDVRVKRGWTKRLAARIPWIKPGSPYYNLVSDESQIWQELNVAWSWHEIVSDFVRPTLAWLEKKGRADLDKLVEKYSLDGNLRCLTEHQEGC